jgi:hypothetical protein
MPTCPAGGDSRRFDCSKTQVGLKGGVVARVAVGPHQIVIFVVAVGVRCGRAAPLRDGNSHATLGNSGPFHLLPPILELERLVRLTHETRTVFGVDRTTAGSCIRKHVIRMVLRCAAMSAYGDVADGGPVFMKTNDKLLCV